MHTTVMYVALITWPSANQEFRIWSGDCVLMHTFWSTKSRNFCKFKAWNTGEMISRINCWLKILRLASAHLSWYAHLHTYPGTHICTPILVHTSAHVSWYAHLHTYPGAHICIPILVSTSTYTPILVRTSTYTPILVRTSAQNWLVSSWCCWELEVLKRVSFAPNR